MKITRLVQVSPAFAEALADYDIAVLRNAEPEALDEIWYRVCSTAAAFREGAAFALGTVPGDIPEIFNVHGALNA